jgi:hypothetical protein
VFRIHDSHTGQAEPVQPVRPGELNTWLAVPASADGLVGLRAALVADLVRRVGERHRLLVTTWLPPGTPVPDYQEFNIHPLQVRAGAAGPVDLVITPDGVDLAGEDPGGTDPAGPGAAAHTARWLRPGPVTGPATDGGLPADGGPAQSGAPAQDGAPAQGGAPARGGTGAAAGQAGADPLVLRLALMRYHHQQPAVVDAAAIAAAEDALRSWRAQVAEWANSSSKPMCADYVQQILAAFDGDLDTPGALGSLQRLADDAGIPPGSKFESFARLDHLFGLDLAREVGR